MSAPLRVGDTGPSAAAGAAGGTAAGEVGNGRMTDGPSAAASTHDVAETIRANACPRPAEAGLQSVPAGAAEITARRWRGVVVGCGRMGATHAERIAAAAGGELAAVWDRDGGRAEALSRRFGLPLTASLEDLLDPGTLDWALVATPPDTHRELALRLLGAGVHVLCEKPLALSAADGREIAHAARDAGRLAWTSCKYPYVPDVVRARELLASGALGRVRRISVLFAAPLDPTRDWRGDRRVAGGGVAMDNGPHAFDLAEFLLGPIAELDAREGERRWGSGVDEEVWIDLRGEAGWTGTLALSWTRPAWRGEYAIVGATSGTVGLGWRESWVEGPDGVRRPLGAGYEKNAALEGQLGSFYAALERPDASRVADRGLRDLELVESVYASLRTGEAMHLPSPEPRDG